MENMTDTREQKPNVTTELIQQVHYWRKKALWSLLRALLWFLAGATAGGVGISVSGCTRAQVRTAADVAQMACETVLAGRADIQAQAERQGVSPAQLARVLCVVPDVLEVFAQHQQAAGSAAVGVAAARGALPAE